MRMKALPEGIVIRSIREGDVPAFLEAVGAVARERRWLMALDAFPADATLAFVQDNLARGHPQVVAALDGRIVGWCDIVPLAPFEGFLHNGRLGMGVVAEWRGRGLGGALMDAALALAPTAGFSRIELEAFAFNSVALALYRGRGFVVEGLKRGVRILDGRADDLVCMARQVR
jgi:GNAT superfamily N-acetyltransferase